MSTDSRTSRRALQLDSLIGSLALLTAVSGVGDAISYLGLSQQRHLCEAERRRNRPTHRRATTAHRF
jgi:hypothetical protein